MKPTLREYVVHANRAGPPMSGLGWGYVFGALGAVLFSMKAIFVKLAYQPSPGLAANEVDAITLMALRLGFSMPVYLGIFIWITNKRKKDGVSMPSLKHIFMSGALGVLGYYVCAFLDIQGLKYVTAQLERLLLFTYPVFVVILSVVFLGFKPKPLSMAAIAFGYLGIIVIFAGGDIAQGENLVLGTVMILACAMFFATFQLLSKSMITRLGSSLFTCCAMMTAGVVIFTHLITQNIVEGTLGVPTLTPRLWGLGVTLAFVSTLVPSFMVNVAINRIGPQTTAMLGLISPIATIFFAIFWLGEPFSFWDGVGTMMTLVGIGFYSWYSRKDQATPPNKPPAIQR